MGSSSATVIAGPIPGSTPTAVPSSTPMHGVQQVHRGGGLLEALDQPVEVVHIRESRPECLRAAGFRARSRTRRSCRPRAQRRSRCCGRSAGCPESVAAPANSSAPVMAQPSGITSRIVATNKPTSRPTVRQSPGASGSTSSPASASPTEPRGIAMASTIASSDQTDADDDREHPRPNGIHLGEARRSRVSAS